MSTQRKTRGWLAVAAAIGLLWAGPLAAQTTLLPTTDQAAGYIVFPKVISDTSGLFNGGVAEDTLIQITNTSNTTPRVLECFYVDGTNTCTNTSLIDPTGGACRTSADCAAGGACTLASCLAVNFFVQLTPNQARGGAASTGVQQTGICAGGTTPGLACNTVADCGGAATGCPTLNIGAVPPLSPGVFFGELKCVEVNGTSTSTTTDLPINANDIVGNATIYEVSPGAMGPPPTSTVDVRAYNAIGLKAVSSNGAAQTDTTLTLGGTSGTEYAGCPAQLIVNHFFDNSVIGNASVVTDLTFVPCSERPEGPIVGDTNPTPTQLQFLTFNEFEQRFSSTTSLRCFRETQLSNIDRRTGQESTSVFNVAVEGTLAGQTVVRPVLSSTTPQQGNGVLAVAEEFYTDTAGTHSTAFNVNVRGTKTQADFVIIPAP